MAITNNINELIINKVENQEIYDYLVSHNLINDNELYLVGGESEDTSVLYSPQELTEAQQAQVRANIGAASIIQLNNKVDKVTGKGLSTNDYTTAEKNKLAGIATGATANVGTITEIKANGTSVATSGSANIPAASTSAYGVTKLTNSTSSTSNTLAATASAVKVAYDLANSKLGSDALAPYYTKTEVDNLELITVDDIDAVCGATIQLASEVTF